MSGRFVGDVGCGEAWKALAETPAAALVDVRTMAEWTYVGVPDLRDLGREAVFVEWQSFPRGAHNSTFVEDVARIVKPDQPVYLICRSGARSRAAAELLALAGYVTYNIVDGFEGQLDTLGHRGHGGWKAAGLPWKQN